MPGSRSALVDASVMVLETGKSHQASGQNQCRLVHQGGLCRLCENDVPGPPGLPCPSIETMPARAGLATASLEAVLVALLVVPIAEFPVVDLHPVVVVFRSSGTRPAYELGDEPKLVREETADRCPPSSVAQRLILDNLQKGRGLPVGRNHGLSLLFDGRRRHSLVCGFFFPVTWCAQGGLGRWNLPGLRLDQTARDQSFDVFASLGINPLTFEGESRTVTRDAVNRLGDIVLGAVELPEPERLDRGEGIRGQWTHVVSSAVDEQAQAGHPMSRVGRPAGPESRLIVETRELCV